MKKQLVILKDLAGNVIKGKKDIAKIKAKQEARYDLTYNKCLAMTDIEFEEYSVKGSKLSYTDRMAAKAAIEGREQAKKINQQLNK